MNLSKKEAKNAKFFISKTDWNKVIAYAESAYHQFKSEIGGQLVVIEDKEGDFILKEPVILKQQISSGNCEMEEEALAVHYSKMVGKYGDKVRHCWWHSHHTMGAFWSGTDDSTILENRVQDFSISLVVNLKQEYKLRIQFFYPFKHEENVELNFLEEESERNEKLDTEVKQLCDKFVTTVTNAHHLNGTVYTNGQQGFWGIDDDDEVNQWNHGFGHENDKVDLDKIPEDKIKPIHDLIEGCQDKLLESTTTYEDYLEMRKVINKSLKEYNLQMKLLNKTKLEMVLYKYWPEDFLENIDKKEVQVVH